MRTFADIDDRLRAVPASVVRSIAAIERRAGRSQLFARQLPLLLEQLAHRARIESVRASSAIEQVVVPDARLRAVVDRGQSPRTRPEAELAGYRDALDLVFREPDAASSLTTPYLLRLHRHLWAHTPSPGGRLKEADNRVVDRHADGSRVDRFRTVPARDTPFYISELHDRLDIAFAAKEHHSVLLTAAYALDLLVIHPFDNGNGRVARLATTALLLRSGFDVVRYVPVEGLIDRTSDRYYESLKASTDGWHDGSHDVWPWIEYLAERIAEAYEVFEDRAGATIPAGSKQARVRAVVASLLETSFTFDEIRAVLPGVSDATIRLTLQRLRDEGAVEALGQGRSARWRRIER
ncbi:MAG: Fic family protein [Acidimicrobiales bacterium]